MQAIGEVKTRGGWRGHPNSIAALLAGRKPWSEQRRCKVCNWVAMRGKAYCRRHVGVKTMPDASGRPEQATLRKLEREGLLPMDLCELPVWRDLDALPTHTRAPIRLRLVLLWAERERQPLVWAQVWRQAIAVARGLDRGIL